MSDKTEHRENADDELRQLVVAYANSKADALKKRVAFRDVLHEHGELAFNLVYALT